MRSLKYKLLGKWVTCKDWVGDDTYLCVGESDENIYIYYSRNILKYPKSEMNIFKTKCSVSSTWYFPKDSIKNL